MMASVDSSEASLAYLIFYSERAHSLVTRPRAPRRRGRGRLSRHRRGFYLADGPRTALCCRP